MSLTTMSLQERRARSALVIVVAEVVALVDHYLRSYTAHGASVPPHVTLLSPFFAPVEVTTAVRQRIARVVTAFPTFDFVVTGTNRFPSGVLYLMPEPTTPFLDLIARLRQEFPEVPPYWDQFPEVVPHITIADAALVDFPGKLDEIASAVSARLPLQCAAQEAVLLQRVRPAPAPWDVQGRFSLATVSEPV